MYRNQISAVNQTDREFARSVNEGLSSQQKYLSSKYFYDDRGTALFVEIMQLPEYYLTASELEIFAEQGKEIIEKLDLPDTPYRIIELGAGDGSKVWHLLKHLEGENFIFQPVDISGEAIHHLENSMGDKLPWLKINSIRGDFNEVIANMDNILPKVILFLGSNLGNMTDGEARAFLQNLSNSMGEKDKLILGLDLQKDSSIILPAYNDSQGVTARFNYNLLRRINREMGANFDLKSFDHKPVYDETAGIARSYLVSKRDQSVYISLLQKAFHFRKGEEILLEVSRKYSKDLLAEMLRGTDLEITHIFKDTNNYYADFLLIKES